MGIDVSDHRIADISFRKFDGEKIPFASKSFDVSLPIFVLHHVRNQDTLLKEAKRVSKKHVLVYKNLVENRLDRILTRSHINAFSLLYGASKENGFRSCEGWEKYFKKLGFKVVAKQYINPEIDFPPVKNVRFLLEVPRRR